MRRIYFFHKSKKKKSFISPNIPTFEHSCLKEGRSIRTCDCLLECGFLRLRNENFFLCFVKNTFSRGEEVLSSSRQNETVSKKALFLFIKILLCTFIVFFHFFLKRNNIQTIIPHFETNNSTIK